VPSVVIVGDGGIVTGLRCVDDLSINARAQLGHHCPESVVEVINRVRPENTNAIDLGVARGNRIPVKELSFGGNHQYKPFPPEAIALEN
jgi:hypothetical protein